MPIEHNEYIKRKIPQLFAQWQEFINKNDIVVIDQDLHILSRDNPVEIFKDITEREWKIIRKKLGCKALDKPIYEETGASCIWCFCREPDLYLVTAGQVCRQQPGLLKLFAELLYRESYSLPSLLNKVAYLSGLFGKLKGAPIAAPGTTEYNILARWHPVLEEKFSVKYMVVYQKSTYAEGSGTKNCYTRLEEYSRNSGAIILPGNIKSLPDKRSFTEEVRKKLQSAKQQLLVREFHEQTVFFCLLIKEDCTISIQEQAYLDMYVRCIVLELYPCIFRDLSHAFAQELMGALCIELFNPLSSAQLLIDKLQESILANDLSESNYCLVKLAQQLSAMDQTLNNYARINMHFAENKTVEESKALIFAALAGCPELEKKYKVDKENIHSDLFVLVQKNVFLAVICEIFKNILQHAYPGDFLDKNKKLEPCITISTVAANNLLFLTIANNGKRLDDPGKNCERIFEPGWKETKNSPRSGMGLAFAWFCIARLHNGAIETESDPGRNFRITIKIPLHPMQPLIAEVL